ncbi:MULTISPECIES: MarC family protein [Vitreoscilla]|uniref:UPF0056 membrane protein n=1 Tax=Vitreoscilla stercoraria TaxID=61 RepID=A0ABY4E8W0_VITST|nr:MULTISPECIES: MarC family protein [Vitreoscilla]AUZ03921.1 MarC family integral membrane protein [Vitreoscilla sp. C1]UOO92155.1 NAAT family transporter [Vitreoscilla stercoraria]
MEHLQVFKIIIALMVLINPLSAAPIFLSLTPYNSARERRKIAQTASLTVVIAIALFTILGDMILKVLNISIGSFQVGGGILILLIAIAMMNAQPNPTKHNPEEAQEAGTRNNIAVVPLAIPMLIGPGSISTVIIYSSTASSWWGKAEIIIAGAVVACVCYAGMLAATQLSKLLGATGINIINRIMGMVLAAVSIEIIAGGLKNLFPNLFA